MRKFILLHENTGNSNQMFNYLSDEKEEGILGSILLPSFQIALLTSEDHINRKYAFKVRT